MATVTVGDYTQYGSVMSSQQPALGKTHAMTAPYGAYNLSIKYPFTVDADCNKITFSLSFSGIPTPQSIPGVYEASSLSDAINIVKNSSFRYGIGSASGQTSYNTFKWNVTESNKADSVTGTKSSLVIRGNFFKGTTYYLWLSTNSGNICYVCKVNINSIRGSGTVQSSIETFNPESMTSYQDSSIRYNDGLIGFYDPGTGGAYQRYRIKFKVVPTANMSKMDITFSFSQIKGDFGRGLKAGILTTDGNNIPTDQAQDVTYNSGIGTITITQDFIANTSYYLWIWVANTNWNQANISDVSNVSIIGTKQTYKVTFKTGDGYKLTAVNGCDASSVVHGNDFYFAVDLVDGYIQDINSITVKANDDILIINGNICVIGDPDKDDVGVTCDQTVTVSGVVLGGLVYISDGSELVPYQVYIANGSGWEHYMPYVANGSSFDLCT